MNQTPPNHHQLFEKMEQLHITDETLHPDWKTTFADCKTTTSGLSYEEYTGTLDQPPTDQREHKLIRLPNNLVAICTSDPNAIMAAARINVGVGKFAEPAAVPGLAHLLEHVITMGSAKYPEEDGYESYCSNNGGWNNAFTSDEKTGYFFGIANNALEGALDRLSNHFINPLLSAEAIKREIKAVDSEFKGRLQNDKVRLLELAKALSNPNHPHSRFGSGNSQTLNAATMQLNIDLKSKLDLFFNQYYSSDIMKLVIVGNYSVDQLVEWTVSKFSAILSKGDTRPAYLEHPLGAGALGKIITYQTKSDVYKIKVEFALPEIQSMYATDPGYYINMLLINQEPGSLMHYLKQKNLATSLSFSMGTENCGFEIANITLCATPKGIKQYPDIMSAIFAYFQMLTEAGAQEWYFKELYTMSQLNYMNNETPNADDWVQYVTSYMHNEYIKPEHILTNESQAYNFDKTNIERLLTYFTPDNCRVFIGAQNHPNVVCNSVEKYYGTRYNTAEMPKALVEKLQSKHDDHLMFHMPAKNMFLPENTNIVGTAVAQECIAKAPSLLKKSNLYELWFKQDDQFLLPYGVIKLEIQYPNCQLAPENSINPVLYSRCLNKILEEKLDACLYGGLSYFISCNSCNVEIQLNGYNDKLSYLLKKILEEIKSFKISQCQFDECATELLQAYNNEQYGAPCNQLSLTEESRITMIPFRSTETIKDNLKDVTFASVQEYIGQLFSQTYSKILVTGNFTESDALDIANLTVDLLNSKPMPKHLYTIASYVNIEPGHYIYPQLNKDCDTVNNATMVSIYGGQSSSVKDKLILMLIDLVVEAPFFNQLRTQEQLGYEVQTDLININGSRPSINFSIQGEASPVYLTMRIDKFISNFHVYLEEFTDEQFQALVQSSINIKGEKLKTVDEEADRFWDCITDDYDFYFLDTDIAILESLCRHDLVEAWNKYINPSTAVDYTRVDYHMWSTKLTYPSLDDWQTYPESVLALSERLNSENIGEFSFAQTSQLVQQIAKLNANQLDFGHLSPLLSIYNESDTALEKVVSSESNVLTALTMAHSAITDPKPALLFSASLNGSGLNQTPEGRWIIDDADKFKATHALHPPVEPVMELIPKYQD